MTAVGERVARSTNKAFVTSWAGAECNVGMWEYENEKMRK